MNRTIELFAADENRTDECIEKAQQAQGHASDASADGHNIVVTDANRDALQHEVAPYWARQMPLLGAADAPVNSHVHVARAAWDALSPQQRARVEEINHALELDQESRRAAEELERRRSRRLQNLRDAGVELTDDVERKLVDHELDDTNAVQAVRRWLRSRAKPWLVLTGPVGVGKSVAAARVVAANGGDSLWFRADALCRLFASNYSTERSMQDRVRSVELLLVDDLGCETDPARMLIVLLDLLDHRKSARRHPTLVTTNMARRSMVERYGNEQRLVSRFVESVEWVSLAGDDLRRST